MYKGVFHMTKEEIWEKLATEVKLRGFSPQSYHTYKCNINAFLDWAGKPYEELDEEDFRNYLIFLINEGRIEKGTINNRNGSIRFFLVVILGKNINYMRTARLRGVTSLPTVWSREKLVSLSHHRTCRSASGGSIQFQSMLVHVVVKATDQAAPGQYFFGNRSL